jgi:hypothetical protein
MKIGVAKKIITPDQPELLTQTGMQRLVPTPKNGVLEDLLVEALAFESEGKAAFVTTSDLRTIERSWVFRIKDTLAEKLGVEPKNVLLSSTHNHCSSPIPFKPSKQAEAAEKRANEKIVNGFIEACLEAWANRRPAEMGYAAVPVTSRIGENRRMRLSSGVTVQQWGSGPFCPPGQKLAYSEGSDAKEIRVLAIREPGAETPFAVLTSYPSHIHLCEIPYFNGEAAGAAKLELQRRLGKKTVALWGTGAAGDVDMHCVHPQPNGSMKDPAALKKHLAWFQKSQKILANRFADAVVPAIQQMRYKKPKRLSTRYWSTGDAAARASTDNPLVIINTLALDDIVIASIPGEIFSNYQKRLDRKSPLKKFLLLGYNGSGSGYIPEAIGFEKGGYETMRGPAKKGEGRIEARPGMFIRRGSPDLGDRLEAELLRQFTALKGVR